MKYASGEDPKIGDVVRCVDNNGMEEYFSVGGDYTVDITYDNQLGFRHERGVDCLNSNRFELVRRQGGKFEPQLGWWRLRGGRIALVTEIKITKEYYPISGIIFTNCGVQQSALWTIHGKDQCGDYEMPTDMHKFLAPLEIPDFPEPDIIDGPGTYELESGGKAIVIYQDCNGNWVVAVENDNKRLHTYTSKGKDLE